MRVHVTSADGYTRVVDGLDPRIPGPFDASTFISVADPLRWLQGLFAAHGDVFQVREPLTKGSAVVLSHPDHIYQVLVENFQNYAKGRDIERVAMLMGKGLFVSDGELWRKQRRLIQPAFQKRQVEHLVPTIADANERLVERWSDRAVQREVVDVTHDTRVVALDVTLSAIFGSDLEVVRRPFAILTERSERTLKFARDFLALDPVILDCMRARRARVTPLSDILDHLLAVRDPTTGEPMPDPQIVSEVKTIIVAGHETTAATMAWLWHLVSRDGDVARRLRAEAAAVLGQRQPQIHDIPRLMFARQVIDETLRLYPPGWIFTRRPLAAESIGGYHIPAGTELYISPYIVQRHPRYWDNPDEFQPQRFEASASRAHPRLAYMPFGAGPRMCIGEHMAILELVIHTSMVARRLHFRPASADPVEIDAKINLRSKDPIVMLPERHGND
jgi:cytochrome P450